MLKPFCNKKRSHLYPILQCTTKHRTVRDYRDDVNFISTNYTQTTFVNLAKFANPKQLTNHGLNDILASISPLYMRYSQYYKTAL